MRIASLALSFAASLWPVDNESGDHTSLVHKFLRPKPAHTALQCSGSYTLPEGLCTDEYDDLKDVVSEICAEAEADAINEGWIWEEDYVRYTVMPVPGARVSAAECERAMFAVIDDCLVEKDRQGYHHAGGRYNADPKAASYAIEFFEDEEGIWWTT